jgi:hypothetical protein
MALTTPAAAMRSELEKQIAHADRLLADNELDREDLEHRLGALTTEMASLPDDHDG